MDKIKVIIADDSDFVRDGMKIILDVDDEFEVIGTAANGREAIDLAEKQKPDVFLMDIQMPEMDGIEATKYIVEHNLGKVLILTTFDDDDLVKRALKNGAKGYLIKNHTPDHLKQMIKSVYHGTGVMDENILETFINHHDISAGTVLHDTQSVKNSERSLDAAPLQNSVGDSSPLFQDNYTDRELDIIKAVAEGLSNKQIAEKLYISEGTVKNYITNILSKENLSHRTALAVYYLTGKK